MNRNKKSLEKVALELFGDRFRSRRGEKKFRHFKTKLFRARIDLPVEEYLSVALFYSILVTIFALIFFLFLLFILPAFAFEFILSPLELLLILLFILILLPLGTFAAFYFYPDIKILERKTKIDAHLPHSICYLSSMAKLGVSPYTIFKTLADREDSYGEVSREAKMIVRDVELLGYDFIAALRNLTVATVSTNLRTFLQGATTTSTTGGEMSRYFLIKAEQFMNANRRKYADYIETLGIVSEVYITAMVAGPLFFIILLATMVMIGAAAPITLAIIIYLFIPLGTFFFLLLIDSLAPEEV